ncbi:hypothetical protein KY343_05125 [Candidatus Woesearchaeota archaeon]|nr:hypothetical protein [Candidatus Woesearchaeota archaeon]
MIAKYLFPIGIGFLFLEIILIVIASLAGAEKGESKAAVGGIIGFIPFGFGTDKRLVWFSMILTAVIFVFFILMNYLWR